MAGALDDAGVEYRVFKGVALANTVYVDPALRVFADVDVLVPTPDFGRAARVLEFALGARRALPELRPGFDARFGKEAMLRTVNGLELDLHRTFVDGGFGLRIDLDDLFASPRRFALGSREVATLLPAHLLLSSCYAAALGDWPPRLASQRDVVQMLKVDAPTTGVVLDLARAWRCESVLRARSALHGRRCSRASLPAGRLGARLPAPAARPAPPRLASRGSTRVHFQGRSPARCARDRQQACVSARHRSPSTHVPRASGHEPR
jgi:Uncharacterised nucleotidyltransferase